MILSIISDNLLTLLIIYKDKSMFFQKLLYGTSLLLLWSAASNAEDIILYSADKLNFIEKDGTEQVYNAEGKLFSGATELPDSAGHNTIYLYKDGQKSGVSTTYYADKKPMLQTSYENGMKNGAEVAYHPNGNPQYRRIYKNNILNGEEILFNEAGKPQKQSQYTDGVLNGTVNYFDDEGNLNKVETYKNGVKDGVERIVKNNTLVAEDTYVNGRINGVSKRYSEKYLTDEIEYVDGWREGWHKHYGEDGTRSEIPYHNDKKNGTATVYLANNKIARTTMYADDMKNGFERKFAENGSLVSDENYRNDKQNGISRYYNKDGEIAVIKFFDDGAEKNEVDLQQTEAIAPLYNKYKEGKIGPLLKQRNMWYRILWLGITLDKSELVDTLEKAMKMHNLAIDDMEVYQRFSGEDFAADTSGLYFGMTPFMYAAAVSSSPEIIQKFKSQLSAANTDGETPLQYALLANNIENLKFMLSLLSPDDKNTANSLLFYALQNGANNKTIEQLLQKADVKATDADGRTPLDYAVKNNAAPEIIEMLVNAGADIAEPQYKHLLVQGLQQNKPVSYINILTDKGVAVSGLDDDGHSVLYYAEVNNYPAEIIKKLQDKGASWTNADKQTLLKNAAEQGDFGVLKKLSAEQMAEVTDNGRSALQYAYDIGATDEIMQYLMDSGADINHQDRDGNTILHDALAKQDIAAAQKFIEKGAAVNVVNNYGKSAISYVLTGDKAAEIYDTVWDNITADDAMLKMPEGGVPLWKYLYLQNKWDALKTLFAKVENPLALVDENGRNAIDLLSQNPDNAEFIELIATHLVDNDVTTLRAVVNQQQADLLRKMKTDKLDMNEQDEYGEILLTSTYKKGTTPDFLQALLDKGADINQQNVEGKNVLDLAFANNNIGMIKFMVEHGADVNKVNNDRIYLMDCKRDSTELTELFIAHNADVSHVTADGENVLMVAIRNLNMPLIKYALERNVDVNAKDSEGLTATLYLLKALEQYGAEDEGVRADVLKTLKLLAEHKADLNVRDYDGQTVLVAVARQYPDFYKEFAEVFVAVGGNPEIKDQYDKKAEDYIRGQ